MFVTTTLSNLIGFRASVMTHLVRLALGSYRLLLLAGKRQALARHCLEHEQPPFEHIIALFLVAHLLPQPLDQQARRFFLLAALPQMSRHVGLAAHHRFAKGAFKGLVRIHCGKLC